jgi:hypothetical protein
MNNTFTDKSFHLAICQNKPSNDLRELAGEKEGILYLARQDEKKRAERVGFEPTVTHGATTVFETVPFNRSGTSPNSGAIIS